MNENPTQNVIVRLPPSPTGKLHVGNLRTLLFNYLFARKHNGKVILRIEDTDTARSERQYEDYIKDSLGWIGISWDEFHRQSDRTEIYREKLEQLITEGKAYVSEEKHTEEALAKATEEGKTLRDSVIRFKNPGSSVTFTDAVLGEITTDTTDLGDFVIAKDLDTPIYHFTVTVDDSLMTVSHVIRGADHVANTPRQILLIEAMGYSRPVYAHVPLVVGKDGKKLSKRHGDTSVMDYKERGYLPEAFMNFLAFIGWNPGTEQEIFSQAELLEAFDLDGIGKSPAVFDTDKLAWINNKWLQDMPKESLESEILSILSRISEYKEATAKRALSEIIERIDYYGELSDMVEAGEYDYLFTLGDYEAADLAWRKSTLEEASKHLQAILEKLSEYDGEWNKESLKESLWDYAEEHGKGDVLWPLRFALSGKAKSPDPFSLLEILGKEESLVRISKALEKIT